MLIKARLIENGASRFENASAICVEQKRDVPELIDRWAAVFGAGVCTEEPVSSEINDLSTTAPGLMVRRPPSGIRIRTRRGYDWTERFPLTVETASRLRGKSFVLDWEGAIPWPDGVSDFDAA
jgi:hypothetical protein